MDSVCHKRGQVPAACMAAPPDEQVSPSPTSAQARRESAGTVSSAPRNMISSLDGGPFIARDVRQDSSGFRGLALLVGPWSICQDFL
ncbi:uncharacterized protein TrAFT101_005616 [Trichoderma asperellum]|uniref:uncharacterized protein n=1 Tax=Trichoderma asperellum TaxID=101201 RepID=UPI003333C156|nr:hypothetical protein TrAFT101_005616 [Trichoderma asperellum]